MDAALIRQVWRRAAGRCEYCQLSQKFNDRPVEIDHICSLKHRRRTIPGNFNPPLHPVLRNQPTAACRGCRAPCSVPGSQPGRLRGDQAGAGSPSPWPFFGTCRDRRLRRSGERTPKNHEFVGVRPAIGAYSPLPDGFLALISRLKPREGQFPRWCHRGQTETRRPLALSSVRWEASYPEVVLAGDVARVRIDDQERKALASIDSDDLLEATVHSRAAIGSVAKGADLELVQNWLEFRCIDRLSELAVAARAVNSL